MALYAKEPPKEDWWRNPNAFIDLPGRNLNTQSVHWYFYNSHFFDHAANNSVVVQEAKTIPSRQHLLWDRKAFEQAVQTLPSGGLQFITVGEPQTDDAPWIMQKQQRTVQRGSQDSIEVLETYWIWRDLVMKAPNLADILNSRFLSISTSLTNFFGMASGLAIYTPATGHTYLPPSYKSSKPGRQGSVSRAGSLAPEGSDRAGSVAPESQPGLTSISDPTDSVFPDRFFMDTLGLMDKFGNQYMDENPLRGEPGSFVFSSTSERVAARNAAQAAAQQKVVDSTTVTGVPVSQVKPTDSAINSAAPTPKPPADGVGSGAKKSKTKDGRRKSKPALSPTTPAG
ncbi:hypothetical protein GQ43DRAFT_469777 [Delitschia confertaspora ATCC 74209]|uniref:Mediator of RNA polymerase II transcription subunit 6 n=1 Tax=Delitschia confertaspora ATCC 74209 TaxID=1513339 RepID=A0A9P4MXX8_9PLEO|nr:hypothetical protein GQ43DRAFT_469777 [Delitschia confertaspora ATCC 74209]